MCALLGNDTSKELETLSPGEQLYHSNHMPDVLSGVIMGDSQDLGLEQAWKEKLVVPCVKVPSDGMGHQYMLWPLCGAFSGEMMYWGWGWAVCWPSEGLGGCTRCSDPLFLIFY